MKTQNRLQAASLKPQANVGDAIKLGAWSLGLEAYASV